MIIKFIETTVRKHVKRVKQDLGLDGRQVFM